MVPIEDPALRARLIEILHISSADNVKSWSLTSDGSYVRTPPKPGAPLVRSQSRFIEITRNTVKVADAAARPSTRFHMTPTAQRSPLEGKVPKTTRRRKEKSSLGE
jgi:polyphosphate kinase